MRPFIERGRAAAGWLSWAVVGAASAIFLLSPVLYLVTRPVVQVGPEPAPLVRGCRAVAPTRATAGVEDCPEIDTIVEKTGWHRWRVDAAGWGCRMRTATHPHRVFGGIVPVYRDGVATGFRVFPGSSSLGAALGFQPGDIIERINGLSLTSPDRALEALEAHEALEAQVRAGVPLRVVLLRRGEQRVHLYEVIPAAPETE